MSRPPFDLGPFIEWCPSFVTPTFSETLIDWFIAHASPEHIDTAAIRIASIYGQGRGIVARTDIPVTVFLFHSTPSLSEKKFLLIGGSHVVLHPSGFGSLNIDI